MHINPHATTTITTPPLRRHHRDRLAAKENREKYSCIFAVGKERGRKSVAHMIEDRKREI